MAKRRGSRSLRMGLIFFLQITFWSAPPECSADVESSGVVQHFLRVIQSGDPVYNQFCQAFRNLRLLVETPAWEAQDHTLIWSGPAPGLREYHRAKSYCECIGAKLPSQEEFWALSRALGAAAPQSNQSLSGYNPSPFPASLEDIFWTETKDVIRVYAYVFSGYDGYQGLNHIETPRRVVCVFRSRVQDPLTDHIQTE